jgi:hypothetical protein
MDGDKRAELRDSVNRLGGGLLLLSARELSDLLADSERAERYHKALERILMLNGSDSPVKYQDAVEIAINALQEPTDATERK